MPQYHSGNTQPIDWWISNFENTDGNCLLKDIHLCVQAEQDDYLHYVQHNPEHEAVWDRAARALSKSRMPALRSLKVEVSIERSVGVFWRPVPPSSVCDSMNDCIEAKLATLESRGVTVQVIVKTPRWSRRLVSSFFFLVSFCRSEYPGCRVGQHGERHHLLERVPLKLKYFHMRISCGLVSCYHRLFSLP